MQYAIFPMKTISITQKYHDGHKALDMAGEDAGIDYWYAPCRLKVMAIFSIASTGFYNTVIYTSVDEAGNPTPIKFADGRQEIVSFSCTHMDSVNKFGLKVGKIYESGERCYCEGNTGLSTGNHVHMGVSLGVQSKIIKYPDGKWYMPDIIDPDGLFHILKGWNVIKNLNVYSFPQVESREIIVNGKEQIIANFERAYCDLMSMVRGTN